MCLRLLAVLVFVDVPTGLLSCAVCRDLVAVSARLAMAGVSSILGHSHLGRAAEDRKCYVCGQESVDARHLPCSHRFCAKCIDQLSVFGGKGRLVQCPLCRTLHQISKAGASDLPQDIPELTAAVARGSSQDSSQPSTCVVCRGLQQSKAKFICATCFSPLCKDHAVYHVTSSPGTHSIKLLPSSASKSTGDSLTSNASANVDPGRFCAYHDEPLALFCVSCDVAICEYCATSIGEHSNHKPVKNINDVVKQRKAEAVQTVEHLQDAVSREVQQSLQDLDGATKHLARRSANLRIELRACSDRLVDLVRCCLMQKLRELDDMERAKLGELNEKRDVLEQQAGGISRAVNFYGRVVEHSEGAQAVELLGAFTRRAASLMLVDKVAEGHSSASLTLKQSSGEDVAAKMSSYFGELHF